MNQPPAPAALPAGWTARAAAEDDVDALYRVAAAHDRAGMGRPTTSRPDVEMQVAGSGAATRAHQVVVTPDGDVVAWGSVQDRAAGRSIVAVLVDPDLDDVTADAVGGYLFGWAEEQGRVLAGSRGLESGQLDSGAFAGDERQHRWLAKAGYTHVRTWWQMSRPVEAAEGEPGAFPDPKPGVVVRQVIGEDGEPDTDDLRRVHDVLEAAFTDHFNYHEETFDEFVERLRADPGHAWDHWWLAEVEDGEPAGALVASVSHGAEGTPDGSYVDYLGVTRAARGRGVARSLLHAVIADAAARGRDRVGLEVDADSPTGADALYQSTGFVTKYVTESWHRDIDAR